MPVKRKVFVINLPKETERFEFVKSQFDRLGVDFERIDGVDADSLGKEFVGGYSPEANRKTYVRPLHKGQIACFLAHLRAWERIVSEDLDYAVILEDDVIINDDFPKALEFFDKTFGEWDFVRIQSNSKPKKPFCEKKCGHFSLVQYINTPGDARGQAVSKNAARKMADGLIPFGMPVDIVQQYFYKIGVRIDSLRPPVVLTGDIAKNSIISRFDTNNKSHYPFVRQVLSVKFYTGRILRLVREYGLRTSIANFVRMIFADKVR